MNKKHIQIHNIYKERSVQKAAMKHIYLGLKMNTNELPFATTKVYNKNTNIANELLV